MLESRIESKSASQYLVGATPNVPRLMCSPWQGVDSQLRGGKRHACNPHDLTFDIATFITAER